jgi:hypothetical protein
MACVIGAADHGAHIKRKQTALIRGIPPFCSFRIPIWLPEKFEADFEFQFCAGDAEQA